MSELVETRRPRGLVSQPSSDEQVRSARYEVPTALTPIARRFWSGRWRFEGGASHTTRMLADPCVNVVFERTGPHAGGRVVGVWTRLWTRTLEGDGLARGLKLRPGAVRGLLDRPAHSLADRIAPLSAVLGTDVTAIERAVLAPDDDAEAFEAFAAWASARVRTEEREDVSLAVAIAERVEADPGITSVERLADVSGVSPRGLQRLFRAHLGASPKWLIRRNRLQEVAARIEAGEAPSLAALAMELGYTDQAHLARDFKHAVGTSPVAHRRAFHGR